MKTSILSLILILLLVSCLEENDFNPQNITVNFSVSDTSGFEKHQFLKNEEFLVTFKVSNNSGKELSFYSSPPVVVYSVLKEDSIISRSTDEMIYIAIFSTSKLKDGDFFQDKWIGPNSLGRKDSGNIITLEKGFYQIEVNHASFFIEYLLPKTDLITIEIIE